MPFAQRKKLLERSRSKKKKSKTASQSDVITGSLVRLSRVMKKLAFTCAKTKTADQRLCFGYRHSVIPLLAQSEISSL